MLHPCGFLCNDVYVFIENKMFRGQLTSTSTAYLTAKQSYYICKQRMHPISKFGQRNLYFNDCIVNVGVGWNKWSDDLFFSENSTRSCHCIHSVISCHAEESSGHADMSPVVRWVMAHVKLRRFPNKLVPHNLLISVWWLIKYERSYQVLDIIWRFIK